LTQRLRPAAINQELRLEFQVDVDRHAGRPPARPRRARLARSRNCFR